MTTFKIDAKNNLMKFPTEVSPFIFKELKELVEQMLKEGNEATRTDRKHIKGFVRGLSNGCDVCWGVLAGITVIGLPFYFCYLNKKAKNSRKAKNMIIKTWEEIAKKYNAELTKLGVFARMVNFDVEAGYLNFNKCSFEFTFNYHIEMVNLNALVPHMININNNAVNKPAPVYNDVCKLDQVEPAS